MDIESFLREIRSSSDYRGQIVYVHEFPARPAEYAGDSAGGLTDRTRAVLARLGFERLYSHQAEAIGAILAGQGVVVVTGTASGKSLCYLGPILEMILHDPEGRALLLFPTKALCQDQFKSFGAALAAAGRQDVLAGVYDGDTPLPTRRKLRDHGSVIFSNPDMLHAALMPQHARWGSLLANLRYLVVDELHVYSGMFGSNMANLMRRFEQVCRHHGSRPRVVACSATIGNPAQLAWRVIGRRMKLIDRDGSPRGRRVYVLWNPPRLRNTAWRSRRSANVEAHELMAELIRRGAATITFSKAKMTAEMIHRYVCQNLHATAPQLMSKVTPYRGGYQPQERREIERRLFAGELLGVSATRALELGIDVGALDACIIVGYPGTLASFFQQAGRAGRRDRDAPAGDDFVAVSGGINHSLAMRANGTIAAWGWDFYGLVSDTPAGAGFTAISAGPFHNLALAADGTIAGWGDDGYGQVSDTPAGSGFRAVAAGGFHSLAVRADGTIAAWGYDTYGQVSDAPPGDDFVAVAGGNGHSLALRTDGTMVCWGDDRFDQVSDTPSWPGHLSIDGGGEYSLAIRSGGWVASWGLDLFGVVSGKPRVNGFTAVAAGNHAMALAADGTIVVWGQDGCGQITNAPTYGGFTAIAAGADHCLALIPEPAAMALLGLGGVALLRRKRGFGG